MIFLNDQTTNEALLNTLGEEQAAAWVRFYAIEVDSRPGEHENVQTRAAAERLGRRGRPRRRGIRTALERLRRWLFRTVRGRRRPSLLRGRIAPEPAPLVSRRFSGESISIPSHARMLSALLPNFQAI